MSCIVSIMLGFGFGEIRYPDKDWLIYKDAIKDPYNWTASKRVHVFEGRICYFKIKFLYDITLYVRNFRKYILKS